MPSPLYRLLALVVCLLLAACAMESAPPAPAVPPAPQTLSARDAAARQIRVDPTIAARLISQYRAAHGLGAVAPDPVLQKLAQAQADAMAAHDVLSHTIAGTLNARFDAVDLGDAAGVENVSAGYSRCRRHWPVGGSRRRTTPICSRRRCGGSALRWPMRRARAILRSGRSICAIRQCPKRRKLPQGFEAASYLSPETSARAD